jgi:hypothetical protein
MMNTFLQLASLGALALIPKVAGETTTNTKLCVELEVPVPVNATNQLFDQPRVDSTIDAIDWTVWVSTRTTPPITERVIRNITINETFKINAQLCVPSDKGPKADILQIATPGLGFDKRSVMRFASKSKSQEITDAWVNIDILTRRFNRISTPTLTLP